MSRCIAIIVAVAAAMGCALPVALTPAGERVVLTRGEPDDERMALGRIRCSAKGHRLSRGNNSRACEVELRNQAATMGGERVVIHEVVLGDNAAALRASVYGPRLDPTFADGR